MKQDQISKVDDGREKVLVTRCAVTANLDVLVKKLQKFLCFDSAK
jgi:hypothetical protein